MKGDLWEMALDAAIENIESQRKVFKDGEISISNMFSMLIGNMEALKRIGPKNVYVDAVVDVDAILGRDGVKSKQPLLPAADTHEFMPERAELMRRLKACQQERGRLVSAVQNAAHRDFENYIVYGGEHFKKRAHLHVDLLRDLGETQ